MSGWDQFTKMKQIHKLWSLIATKLKPGKECKGSESPLKQLMTSNVGGCATKVNEVYIV